MDSERNRLFHAIVLVGVAFAGGCSSSPLQVSDASADRSQDRAADAGHPFDATDAKDHTVFVGDGSARDGTDAFLCIQCIPGDGGTDSGFICFPCYV